MAENQEKREVSGYEIIHAIRIGDKEVVFGIDDKNTEAPYLCAFYKEHGIIAEYFESMAGDDYVEMMGLFFERLQGQVKAIQQERDGITVPLDMVTPEQCIPNSYDQNIEGQIIESAPMESRRITSTPPWRRLLPAFS